MNIDDPAVRGVLRRAMIARIATLSRNRRPSINPLYYVYQHDRIWLGTTDWTLAARNAKADPRVSVLFEIEHDCSDPRILRIKGRASVIVDRKTLRAYNLHTVLKYILTPVGIRHYLTHFRLLLPMHYYHAQSAEKGQACVIEITPEQIEFVNNERRD